jgi:hypothetical protein
LLLVRATEFHPDQADSMELTEETSRFRAAS